MPINIIKKCIGVKKNTYLDFKLVQIKSCNYAYDKIRVSSLWCIRPSRFKSKNGLNLTLNNFHTKVRAINRIGPHNQDVISVIVGSLLGDCYDNKRSIEGTRFVYKQSIIHKSYFFWLYTFLILEATVRIYNLYYILENSKN